MYGGRASKFTKRQSRRRRDVLPERQQARALPVHPLRRRELYRVSMLIAITASFPSKKRPLRKWRMPRRMTFTPCEQYPSSMRLLAIARFRPREWRVL